MYVYSVHSELALAAQCAVQRAPDDGLHLAHHHRRDILLIRYVCMYVVCISFYLSIYVCMYVASPLDHMHPLRPLRSLFHPAIFLSTFGQAAIHIACMTLAVHWATEVSILLHTILYIHTYIHTRSKHSICDLHTYSAYVLLCICISGDGSGKAEGGDRVLQKGDILIHTYIHHIYTNKHTYIHTYTMYLSGQGKRDRQEFPLRGE